MARSKKSSRITLLTTLDEVTDSRSAFPGPIRAMLKATELSQDDLSESLLRFLSTINAVLETAVDKDAKYVPDEIELNLVVNASGGVELVGKVNSGVQTSIKLVLRRNK